MRVCVCAHVFLVWCACVLGKNKWSERSERNEFFSSLHKENITKIFTLKVVRMVVCLKWFNGFCVKDENVSGKAKSITTRLN